MKGRISKYLPSLTALLAVSLAVAATDAASSDRRTEVPGIYTVKVDNKEMVKVEHGDFIYEPVYISGVALDEHTLVFPLAYGDDAEEKKFLFYFMDKGAGLMALITLETLKPVKLSNSHPKGADSEYRVVSRQNGPNGEKGGEYLGNVENNGTVDFTFNRMSELTGISFSTHVDSKAIEVFYYEYLRVIREDGGVDEVFRKLLPPE